MLAIGVGEYNEAAAKHLRLTFADDGAHDVVFVLLDTQGSLYARVKAQALRKELHRLAERGRVLVLLDACRSGAATADGADIKVDARLLRTALATANVTVLTSSLGEENSLEHEAWQNGAFTAVFLEALGRGADSDRNGVISMTELTRHMTAGVPRLVYQVDPERKQTPGKESS